MTEPHDNRLEVPNKEPHFVTARQLLESEEVDGQ